MVPDSDPVSALAVYNQSKNSGKSRRRKARKERKKAERSQEALEEPTKKKMKKDGNKVKNGGNAKSKKSNKAAKDGAKVKPVGSGSSTELKVKPEPSPSPKGNKLEKNGSVENSNIQNRPSSNDALSKKSGKKKPTHSFSFLNDSLDVASTSTFRSKPSSTPAKPPHEISEWSDEDSNSADDIRSKVDSYKAELSASKKSLKRKKRLHQEVRMVKKRALDDEGSEVMGREALSRLLHPMDVDTFMNKYWEKQLLYVPAKDPNRFAKLLSTEKMDKALRNESLCFGKDLDVTTYTDGEKQNHNIEGSRAQAHVVWDFYANGCSIRLLHPHTHSKPLLFLMSALQEYFGCLVGANSYLTPPSSQGFAPHYDDIEAFILQLEGKKRWKVYKPRSKQEILPRFSSPNFSEEELPDPPVFDAELSPGDLLYFPRGYIHQAHTLHDKHSLHVTISAYQKTAWCDLLEKMVPVALKAAAANEIEYRRGLPIGYLRQAGVFTKHSPSDKKALVQNAKQLLSKLVSYIDIDSAVDEMGVQFMHDALPPVLTPAEAACSVVGNGWRMDADGKLRNKIEFPSYTRVRLTRAYCYRLVQEDIVDPDGHQATQVSLYYTNDNSKLYHGEEPNFLVVEPDLLITLRALVNAYPQFTVMSKLPCDSEDKMYGLICDLWDHGLLVTETPPEPIDDQTVVTDSNISESNGALHHMVDTMTSYKSSEDEDYVANEGEGEEDSIEGDTDSMEIIEEVERVEELEDSPGDSYLDGEEPEYESDAEEYLDEEEGDLVEEEGDLDEEEGDLDEEELVLDEEEGDLDEEEEEEEEEISDRIMS